MRALRILLITVVILGGLFVAADRLAVHFAEGEVADRLKSRENLSTTPDVSINGFPFLTQVAGGELDDVEVGIDGYEAATADGSERVRVDDLRAHMKGVDFSGDFSSATAATARGTATIAYDELLKAADPEPSQVAPGVTARIVGLSDGGNGKIDVAVEVTLAGKKVSEPAHVLSSVTVKNNRLGVKADNLPELGGVTLAESRIREITDFQQTIDELPGGIKLDKVEAAKDGVDITVRGTNIVLAG
ncbi:LmeA family phospholipid-binding protein [Streptomyces fumanus]|uniref:DUF2993 domain-containing protein n=1 Tax=Streptomyces fumanus TaxID=67302 RepID=A0A919E229_9ACTN|nr:DUF2993 domain-containing protein [Streptomyces fumanus]GHF02794.1 hypothetical protein GCM10018772_29370 [Streptomyces fumanus]